MFADQKVKETGHIIDPPTFHGLLAETPTVSRDIAYPETCPSVEEYHAPIRTGLPTTSRCATFQVEQFF
jgi:hypothetical protein